MDSKTLPILFLALSKRNDGANGKELAETLLLSSDVIPQLPRTVLSIKTAKDRADAQVAQDAAIAQEIVKAFEGRLVTKLEEDELKRLPALQRVVGQLPAADRLKVINPLPVVPPVVLSGDSADGNSRPSKEKERQTNLVAARQK